MFFTGGNKHLFDNCRRGYLPGDLELHLALQHHHNLIGGMDEIGPDLPGRISPQVTSETAPIPIGSYLILVGH